MPQLGSAAGHGRLPGVRALGVLTPMAWCVICTAAVGPWGLLALLPAVLVAVFILVGFVRRRRRPIDAVVGRLSNEMWAWQSAMAAHDPRLDQVTASMVVRAPLRRRLPRR